MDELDLITARSNVAITINKMRNTCDELKAKSPHKTELINSMEATIGELTFSYTYFCVMEAEYRAALQINNSNTLVMMQQNAEIEKLKKEITEIKNYL